MFSQEAIGAGSPTGIPIVRFIDRFGFDVVGRPSYDPTGVTAMLAANLAYGMLSLVALPGLEGGA